MKNSKTKEIVIIWAWLAGCEAALQMANSGYKIIMYDNKNIIDHHLYQRKDFWELICMNTLWGINANIPSWLCRIELENLGCKMLEIAHKCEIKNDEYLAINKQLFSELVNKELKKFDIKIIEKDITEIPSDWIIIVATGPNTNEKLMKSISKKFNNQKYYKSSALSPAIYENSINFNKKNIKKINKSTYQVEISDKIFEKILDRLLIEKPTHMHYIDQEIDLTKNTPIENIAKENINQLKNKFYNKKTKNYSITIKKDPNLNGVFNVVDFYTRIWVYAQIDIFKLIPWFENIKFARFGLMHKDTYFNSPNFLNKYFKVKNSKQPIYIIWQVSGCDWYLRAFASAIIASNNIIYWNTPLSTKTMIGWLANYISNKKIENFQPISATYWLIKEFTNPKKQEKESIKLINQYKKQLSTKKINK